MKKKRREDSPSGDFDVLPDELIVLVFHMLPASALAACAVVCKRLHGITSVDSLWRSIILQALGAEEDLELPEGCVCWKDLLKNSLETDKKPLYSICAAQADTKVEAIRITIIGCAGVGKSILVLQFVESRFFDCNIDPTIEDIWRKQIMFGDTNVVLEIFDTANGDQFHEEHAKEFPKTEVYLALYSVADKQSLKDLPAIIDDALALKKAPVIIMGGKMDLPRTVPSAAGKLLAARYGGLFVETSGKTKENVILAFELALSCTWHEPSTLPSRHAQDTGKKKRCCLM